MRKNPQDSIAWQRPPPCLPRSSQSRDTNRLSLDARSNPRSQSFSRDKVHTGSKPCFEAQFQVHECIEGRGAPEIDEHVDIAQGPRLITRDRSEDRHRVDTHGAQVVQMIAQNADCGLAVHPQLLVRRCALRVRRTPGFICPCQAKSSDWLVASGPYCLPDRLGVGLVIEPAVLLHAKQPLERHHVDSVDA